MEKSDFIETFNDLLAETGLNRKQFAEKCGVPYTTVIGWTSLNRLPDFTALIKIADFFSCSIDYLTGRQTKIESTVYPDKIPAKESTLLKHFRNLNPDNKDLVIKLVQNLSQK